MPTYEVIVGNVGSVYYGKNRRKAVKIHRSYVVRSQKHIGARCYGEDVTLFTDAEIETEHTGHLIHSTR
jgi:hypothetical protein